MPLAAEGAVGQQHADRSGAAGQGGHGESEVVHAGVFEHARDHAVVDLAGGLAGHDEPGAHGAELDGVGHLEDAVHHAQAGVGDVVDGAVGAHAHARGHGAGRGRLAGLAADARVDEGAELRGRDAAGGQGLAAGARPRLRRA